MHGSWPIHRVRAFLDGDPKGFHQPPRRSGDVGDGRLEDVGIARRRGPVAADLATYWRAAASSSPVVAAVSARRRVLMLLHMSLPYGADRRDASP